MDGHLVAVEVGVEGGAGQRVNLDGFAFDQDRLKRLNSETMQRGRAVQQDRVVLRDLVEDVPDHRFMRSTMFRGLLMVEQWPLFTRRWMMNGLNSSSAIFLGRPH